MRRIVYVSTASLTLNESDVQSLLKQAVERNARHDVTGLLAYNGFNFLQAIEGDAEALEAIFGSICRDPRHSGVITLLDEACEARLFPDWRMRLVRTLGHPLFNTQTRLSRQDVDGAAHVGRVFRAPMKMR